jgi:hypothetical protein
MMPSARFLIAVGIFVALFGPASSFPRWLGEAGRSFRQLAEIGAEQERERAREQELLRRGQALRRRIAAKQDLLSRLLAGQLTLPQAAAAFRSLEDPSQSRVTIPPEWRGLAEGEWRCRAVIAWARERLAALPRAERDRAIRRMEEELDGLLYCHGSIALPLR